MNKILGLDLGTNSIGWALRDTGQIGNQIEKFGVLTFNKGVGLGKKGEYSYAAERTKKRSTRRLYQARKYRLWATLEHLITEGYCPLSMDDLNKWRHYNKEEARKNNNAGRVYPVDNLAFDAWIKLDFNNDGKPDYTSPYQLRHELAITKLDFTKEENRFKLGRALYHIAQRRGFKSSRKGADDTKEKEISDNETMDLQYSEKKKNKNIVELFEKYPQAKTIGSLFALLENDKVRIRENVAQYAIRENYKVEINHIFKEVQKLGLEHSLYKKLVESGNNKYDGSIFYKRPLRSQKGLIGKCTLEPNKYRAPISHPAFEIFRAWSFINNIKFKDNNNKISVWQQLPLEFRQEIYQNLFFRKLKSYFPFSEISDFLKKKGKNWSFNYSPKTTVTACPVSARLKDIFGDDYLNIKIKKTKAPKSDKNYYDIEDIWHVLFSYEDQEYVSEFAEQKLKLNEEKIKQFVIAWNATPVGYAMLSLNAINKINVFLQKGLIYTEAVLLANIPEIIGEKLWKENEQVLLHEISNVIAENRRQKTILNIVNNLIAKHKNLEAEKFGYKNNNYKLVESDFTDIQTAIEEAFGVNRWNEKTDNEKKNIFDTVKDCYQAYFTKQGIVRDAGSEERIVTILSNEKKYYKTETGYYRLPKLIDTLGEFLIDNFNIDERLLSKIYHPSEINIYPPGKPDPKDGVLKLGSPKTGSFKNPMAMRTLHELRKLMNYLIETNQIDNETRIVVEVARELNDANKRWAIEQWQKQREAENLEFAKVINSVLKDDTQSSNADNIDKVRLWFEQNEKVEQILPLFLEEIEEETQDEKGKGKKSKKKKTTEDEIIRYSEYSKKMIDKYRLWKEQNFQCLYTGKFIKLTDLFTENVIDFEHTIPRSKSFDNSLANLTVCYADYNRTVKKNQIPTQLANYEKDTKDYTAILPRLEKWKDKVERIKQQIDFWKTKTKKAADKQWKDDAIRQRHLWQMELDYWQNKLDRFTITEITSGFKNSQKVDTQLISKYAFHYLKTYFDKVDVQKGSITAEFRKIYGLQIADEKKDRSKHSHHAKDAAVLTLIPAAAKRDAILEEYYEAKESKKDFKEEPYKGFKREFIFGIDDNVLINSISNNQALTPAKRKIRKRGKEVIINGKNRWAKGDCIRGQLHQETFYGAIKPAQKGGKGNLLKDEEGNFIQEEKVRYVIRVPFKYKANANDTGFKTLDEIKKQIVDEGLKIDIEKQVNAAGGLKEAFEKGIHLLDQNGKPHGNPIRHIRVWASVSEPLKIKKQTNLSEKEYKQHYYAGNATNSYFAIYKGNKLQYSVRRNLFEVSELISGETKNPIQLFEPKVYVIKDGRSLRELTKEEIKEGKKGAELPLTYILEKDTKIIFVQKNEDLKSLSQRDILKRLYVYSNFEKDGRLNFQYHLEARNKIEETYSESEIDFSNPKPTLRFSYAKYDFLVENYDFIVDMDGTIKWK